VVTPYVWGTSIGRVSNSFATGGDPSSINRDAQVALGQVVGQLATLGSVAALIVLIVWSHHITSTARALGLRTTHTPGWAVAGWLVPILNFWFPYQVVRDALPPQSSARSAVPVWWALYLSASFLLIVALLSSVASRGAGVAMGVIVALTHVGAGTLGRKVAHAIADAHSHAAAVINGSAPAPRL
jgi:hypothetical protein